MHGGSIAIHVIIRVIKQKHLEKLIAIFTAKANHAAPIGLYTQQMAFLKATTLKLWGGGRSKLSHSFMGLTKREQATMLP